MSKDLLDEIKGFKYQITVKALLSKYEKNETSTPVYFNSATKTVINFDKYMLDKSFQKILYRIDNWVKEGSVLVIEFVNKEYVNISIFSPLSGSTYIEFPHRL